MASAHSEKRAVKLLRKEGRERQKGGEDDGVRLFPKTSLPTLLMYCPPFEIPEPSWPWEGSTCIEGVLELRNWAWGFVAAGLAEGLLADGLKSLHAEKGSVSWSRTSLSHPHAF